jgi:hypothetical protein
MKGKGKARADNAIGVDSVLSLLGQFAEEKATGNPLAVAVVGFTNAGKTSFINSLLRKAVLPIYHLGTSNDGPTTTTRAQEVTLEIASKTIRIIDTPGYSWMAVESGDSMRARDILTRSKGRIERLKDPEPVGAFVAFLVYVDLVLLSVPQCTKLFRARFRKISCYSTTCPRLQTRTRMRSYAPLLVQAGLLKRYINSDCV